LERRRFTILHTEWSEGWGGQEMRILLEMTQHARQGNRLLLLSPPGSPLSTAVAGEGIEVIPYKIRHSFDLAALWLIKKILREKQIEVLHTHSSVDSWVASLAGKWAGVPVLVRTRHISVPARSHRFNRVYHFPDAVITTGEHIRRNLIEGYGLPEDRVISIPTGVDPSRFFPRHPDLSLKRFLGLPQESPVITLVAVLRTQKRHELIMAAAPKIIEQFPKTRFLFVGDGPGRNRITQALKQQNLESYFLMTGHRQDIPEILSFTDIAVIPSLAEGIPQFLLQAMAMAKPVVATQVGGIPEIIQQGINGLLIPSEDPQALAGAVCYLLKNTNKSNELGIKAKALVEEKFTLPMMAEKVYQVYLSVYNRKRMGP
jgi:glycosyltransferase involved in cell wall biosynthesis